MAFQFFLADFYLFFRCVAQFDGFAEIPRDQAPVHHQQPGLYPRPLLSSCVLG